MGSNHEREVRAARNQSLFRSVNEKIKAINVAFATITETYEIACECYDVECLMTITVPPEAYAAVRANPRQFLVLRGHVDPLVEFVVTEADAYVVVEKVNAGGEVAEATAAEALQDG